MAMWWLGKKPKNRPANEAYRKGWDAMFGRKRRATEPKKPAAEVKASG